MRKAAATQLAEGLVLVVRILPPVTLLPGLSTNQDAKYFSVGHGVQITRDVFIEIGGLAPIHRGYHRMYCCNRMLSLI